MPSKIKVGDRVRLIYSRNLGDGAISVEGILEEKHYRSWKVGNHWYSEFWNIEKISEEESLDEKKIEEKVEGKNRTTIEEDMINALLS